MFFFSRLSVSGQASRVFFSVVSAEFHRKILPLKTELLELSSKNTPRSLLFGLWIEPGLAVFSKEAGLEIQHQEEQLKKAHSNLGESNLYLISSRTLEP